MSQGDSRAVQAADFPPYREVDVQGVHLRIGRRIAGHEPGRPRVYTAASSWGERLAVKIFEEGARAEWQHESRVLALCRHPNVPHLFATFEHAERLHIVMQRGGRPLPAIEIATPQARRGLAGLVAPALLETLHFLHRFGFVHGAVRPEHVLVRPASVPQPATVMLCGFSRCAKGGADEKRRDIEDAAALLKGVWGDSASERVSRALDNPLDASSLWAGIKPRSSGS